MVLALTRQNIFDFIFVWSGSTLKCKYSAAEPDVSLNLALAQGKWQVRMFRLERAG